MLRPRRFGALGVADRWADLAIATWSTQWNYGPGWERHLLAAYGINRDLRRTAYYRFAVGPHLDCPLGSRYGFMYARTIVEDVIG